MCILLFPEPCEKGQTPSPPTPWDQCRDEDPHRRNTTWSRWEPRCCRYVSANPSCFCFCQQAVEESHCPNCLLTWMPVKHDDILILSMFSWGEMAFSPSCRGDPGVDSYSNRECPWNKRVRNPRLSASHHREVRWRTRYVRYGGSIECCFNIILGWSYILFFFVIFLSF